MSTETLTPSSIHDTVIIPETIAVEESTEAKIARLEAEIAEARTGNLKVLIQQADGTFKTFNELREEHRAYVAENALVTEQARRILEEQQNRNPVGYSTDNGQITWRPQNFSERPLLSEDEAVRLFGLKRWAELTPQQQAKARTCTKSDVDKIDLSQIFGPTSSARRATELLKENPALYKLAKKKALDENKF